MKRNEDPNRELKDDIIEIVRKSKSFRNSTTISMKHIMDGVDRFIDKLQVIHYGQIIIGSTHGHNEM